ncbi:MAG: DUF4093 domain-containing protein [Clostridiales bacterium]|nr:DUF4093 domain-containing protein [Clostridiales bacterium]
MIHLEQAIVVEGKYDKIKLSAITDAVIIVTNGFEVFKNKEKQALIRFYSENKGIIILTDSDTAGFKIRNLIKSIAKDGKITNVYVPDIFGKEKRKNKPSKEGKIGVEGMNTKVIINALEQAGIFGTQKTSDNPVTNLDFYEDGLSGKPNSSELRYKVIDKLGLPKLLTSKGLLEVINSMMSKDEYKELMETINND